MRPSRIGLRLYPGAPALLLSPQETEVTLLQEGKAPRRVALPVRKGVAEVYFVGSQVFFYHYGEKTLRRFDSQTGQLTSTNLPTQSLFDSTEAGLWYGGYRSSTYFQKVTSEGQALGEKALVDTNDSNLPVGVWGSVVWRRRLAGLNLHLVGYDIDKKRAVPSLPNLEDKQGMAALGDREGNVWVIGTPAGKSRQLFQYLAAQATWTPYGDLPADVRGSQPLLTPTGQLYLFREGALWRFEPGKRQWVPVVREAEGKRYLGEDTTSRVELVGTETGKLWVRKGSQIWLLDPERNRWEEQPFPR